MEYYCICATGSINTFVASGEAAVNLINCIQLCHKFLRFRNYRIKVILTGKDQVNTPEAVIHIQYYIHLKIVTKEKVTVL